MRIQVICKNEKELDSVAKVFANLVNAPMIILLVGDLGSGKTTFVKSLAKYLGSEDTVTSPTFTLLNEYHAKFPIYHFDMYRLSSMEDALSVGFEEYFDKSKLDGVCLVEWPENVEGLIKEVDYVVSIEKISSYRQITIKKVGEEK